MWRVTEPQASVGMSKKYVWTNNSFRTANFENPKTKIALLHSPSM